MIKVILATTVCFSDIVYLGQYHPLNTFISSKYDLREIWLLLQSSETASQKPIPWPEKRIDILT